MVRTDERRGAKGRRVALEEVVDVCVGETGGFQAKTLDISGRGMHLRTNLLPKTSEPMVFRFHTPGGEVLAQGEVVWQSEVGSACDFGVRFTALDSRSAQNLTKLCGEAEPIDAVGFDCTAPQRGDRTPTAWSQVAPSRAAQGREGSDGAVRLHVNGLSQPLRAEIREAAIGRLTVGSSLEFLSLGSAVEVEDAKNKARQKAQIGDVSVRVDPATQVPELLVSVTYSKQSPVRIGGTFFDEPEPTPTQAGMAARLSEAPEGGDEQKRSPISERSGTSEAAPRDEDDEAAGDWLEELGSGVAEAAQWVARHGNRVQVRMAAAAHWTVEHLKRGQGRLHKPGASGAARPRRTTSAAPSLNRQGAARQGLRFNGRKRGPSTTLSIRRRPPRSLVSLGLLVAAAGVGTWIYTQVKTPKASNPSVAVLNQRVGKSVKPPAKAAVSGLEKNSKTSASLSAPPSAKRPLASVPISQPGGPVAESQTAVGSQKAQASSVFSRGRLHLPIKHRIRLSNPGLQVVGNSTLTGFEVTIPGTQALGNGEAIAQRDRRIAQIDVENGGGNTKISVRFHRQIPPYKVRVRDHFVEIFISAK